MKSCQIREPPNCTSWETTNYISVIKFMPKAAQAIEEVGVSQNPLMYIVEYRVLIQNIFLTIN